MPTGGWDIRKDLPNSGPTAPRWGLRWVEPPGLTDSGRVQSRLEVEGKLALLHLYRFLWLSTGFADIKANNSGKLAGRAISTPPKGPTSAWEELANLL